MGLSKTCKQHLSLISARAAESHKRRKIDRENEQKKRFSKKQIEEDDFRVVFEELQSESSSDESIIEDCSLVEPSSDENNSEVEKTKGGIIHVKYLERRMEDWGVKSAVLGRFEKMMRAVIFEGYQVVGRQLQINEKGDTIEIFGKIGFSNQVDSGHVFRSAQ